MRFPLLIAAAVCLACSAGPLRGETQFGTQDWTALETMTPACDVGCFKPNWRYSADVMLLQQFTGSLAVARGAVGPPVDQAGAGDYMAPGVRVTAGQTISPSMSWEILYYGQNNWGEDETVLGDSVNREFLVTSPNLIIDDIVGGFDSFIRFEYDSELHNFEFTRRILRQYDDWAYSTLLGVRYTDFQERLHLFGEDITFNAFEDLQGRSTNHMVGCEIGLLSSKCWGRWLVDSEVKGALMGNFWRQNVLDVGDSGTGAGPSGVLIDIDRYGFTPAIILDMNTRLSYQILPHWWLRGGTQFLYMAGVARQPTNNGKPPNGAGDLLVGGFTAGLEIYW